MFGKKAVVQPIVAQEIGEAGEAIRYKKVRRQEGLNNYFETQRSCWEEQRQFDNPWLINHFITLGSPLAHAQMLLAENKHDFKRRIIQKELPINPPVRDKLGYAFLRKPIRVNDDFRFWPVQLHYAAPFATTRWTNIYFPAKFGIFGDSIGGELSKVFGQGIKDVPVTVDSWRRYTLLAHNMYWYDRRKMALKKSFFSRRTERKHTYAMSALREAIALH